MRSPRTVALLSLAAGVLISPLAAQAPDFNRDIRPILAENCFSCHGFDPGHREANLRLDTREGATAENDGVAAIVPGNLAASALWHRIRSTDPDEVMPPPKTHKSLTAAQKDLLRRWIEEGAPYEKHWSFVPPADAPPPPVIQADWPRNGIDAFVLARLESGRLKPSPEASKETLIRRTTLDLTGLPPSPDEINAFLADPSPQAYEALVDRLLASPHFGERMALQWLDAARYADTNGFQVDRDREIWRWRDWVIDAFNRNLPFDQFTIEQLAGDLLPNPTPEQRIATGFHRNNMMNEEGGIIPEEFLAEYAADRAETTATVWLAQTFNCNRCHDHKYDPFTQADFYSLKAFFHNIAELGSGNYNAPIRENSPPHLKLPAPEIEAEITSLISQLADAEGHLAATHGGDPELPARQERVAGLKKQLTAARQSIPTTLVMEELKEPRATHILIRGSYETPGERVFAGTPGVLPPMTPDLPRNRLGLAQWLVDPANPLTARVTVNRLWQQVFGTGIVASSDDFGAQGGYPSHPELLDWLALDFVRNGWDVKRLMKLLVTSATYRQQSHLTPELLEADPENRLLARGPRHRLPGEFIRDQALVAGGLLVPIVGGPPVKPYHPPGLYEQVTAGTGTNTYLPGEGDYLYRRSLYTYWKRSVPHPAMLAFGTPFRESCTVRRTESNTPLQALNLMNDETYVEAGRFLAERMMKSDATTPADRLAFGFRVVLSRFPNPAELAILVRAHQRAIADFQNDPAAANELLAVGARPADPSLDAAELAAFATVAGTILCMDETVSKP